MIMITLLVLAKCVKGLERPSAVAIAAVEPVNGHRGDATTGCLRNSRRERDDWQCLANARACLKQLQESSSSRCIVRRVALVMTAAVTLHFTLLVRLEKSSIAPFGERDTLALSTEKSIAIGCLPQHRRQPDVGRVHCFDLHGLW